MKEILNIKTISELNDFQRSINENIEARRKELKKLDKASELSNKSFGYIKEAFENIAPTLYSSTKNGKKIMAKYADTIKENRDLSKLHSIYEGLRKATSDTDVDFFVNTLVTNNCIENRKQLKESVHKLGLILGEAYLMISENVDSLLPTENTKLDKAISFISENKKSLSNIAEFSKASYVIKEEISKHEISGDDAEVKDTDILVDEFNEKYQDLDEESIAALKSNNTKEDFDGIKDKCIDCIDGEIDGAKNEEEKERYESIKEEISKKEYNKETFLEDVISLHKIINVLK